MKRCVCWLVLSLGPWIVGRAQAESDADDIRLGERLFADTHLGRPGSAPVSCASCHQPEGTTGRFPRQPAVPAREDGQSVTPRNTQALDGVLADADVGWGLLHWDGEFASLEDLVTGTLTGRNFGWLPGEYPEARAQVAARTRSLAGALEASDDQALAIAARAITAYLRDGERRAAGRRGSAYDAFLAANRLPQGPRSGETPHEYARRLHQAVAALRAPRWIEGPAGFGEEELRGLRIFFRGALGYGRSASAGNCAECHVPPRFTDGAFHNTGSAQDAYEAVHGPETFLRLAVPTLAERNADPVRWLTASPRLPQAHGPLLASPVASDPVRADLGLWNVYGHPDRPGPQAILARKLDPSGRLAPDEVLARSLGRFKTPALRDLDRSAPYLHHGRFDTPEEVLAFYRRMSDLARAGGMRNAPPEYAAMNLAEADLAPLAAFLRSLNQTPAP